MKALRKKVISLGLVITMVLAVIPFMTFAVLADETTPISFDDCATIGYHDVYECDIYYCDIGDGSTVVELKDLEGKMEDGIVTGLFYSGYDEGTNIIDLSGGYTLKYEDFVDEDGYGEYLDEEACAGKDFSNIFGLFIMDDEYDMYVLIINAAYGEEEEKDFSFTAYYQGQELTDITYEENAYSYFDYMKGEMVTVGVYTIKVPNKAEAVDLKVASPCLHYNYTADGEFIGGWVEDYTKGDAEFSALLDYSDEYTASDGEFDYIQIQSPYDASWNSTLYYCITFDMDGVLPPKPVDIDVKYAFGSEWEIIAQARSGQLSEDNAKAYYLDILRKVTDAGTVYLSEEPTTDNARVVLALTAAGFDASNVAGYNLLDPLADLDYAKGSYITNAIYALIALDCHDYGIPECRSGGTQTTREALIDHIYNSIGEDGLVENDWGKDYDSTLMALQALSGYFPNEDTMINKAIMACSAGLSDDCGIDPFGYGMSTCSTSQAVIAAAALGINPDTSPLFSKNGKSIVTFVESMKRDNGFIEMPGDTRANRLATQQGNLALVSYKRFTDGKTSLYDMSDVDISKQTIEGSADGMVIVVFSTPIDSQARIEYKELPITEDIKANIEGIVKRFDISVTGTDGEVIPIENNSMTIGVKLAGVLNSSDRLKAVYILNGSVMETMDANTIDEFIVINVDHLSEFGIIKAPDIKPSPGGNTTVDKGVKTGDRNRILLWILLMLSALGGGAACAFVIKRNRYEK